MQGNPVTRIFFPYRKAIASKLIAQHTWITSVYIKFLKIVKIRLMKRINTQIKDYVRKDNITKRFEAFWLWVELFLLAQKNYLLYSHTQTDLQCQHCKHWQNLLDHYNQHRQKIVFCEADKISIFRKILHAVRRNQVFVAIQVINILKVSICKQVILVPQLLHSFNYSSPLLQDWKLCTKLSSSKKILLKLWERWKV